MTTQKITDSEITEDFNWELNKLYINEKSNRIVYDCEIECKKVSTALKRIAKTIPELDWILSNIDEPCFENGVLSSEYDSIICEENEGTIYIAIQTLS